VIIDRHIFHFLAFLVITALMGCKDRSNSDVSRHVTIQQKDGKYTLYRNGEPFLMKGASGDSHFRMLRESGGNTLRVWDTTMIQTILDSAVANDLAVIIGLPVCDSEDPAFYQNPSKVEKQYQAFSQLVNKHKANPAILMWCVGNELNFPFRLSYLPFYQAFNNITDMIHRDDPDHPVTTTMVNFNPKYIANLELRCDVDVISFNVFGRLPLLRQELKDFSWFWNGPYMILEWGTNGPWQGTEQTGWSAYIEDTSSKKAEIIKDRYQHFLPMEDPRFLGASVFFWGNKQETTHTWFSIFDETGAASEVVGTMKFLWTGRGSDTQYPDIKYMLLDEKRATHNIILNPQEVVNARVLLNEASGNFSKIQWEIYREDWYKKNNQNSTKKLTPLRNIIKSAGGLHATVMAPAVEGPYRLFATIYAGNGTFASCNTPFYVVGK
jgi:hypothetical protein